MIKKINAFDAFTRGIEQNYKTLLNIFPTIFILIVAINVFINSGIIDLFNRFFNNHFIKPELIIQASLRPISHSSAMLVMTKIFDIYGVDSITGKISSILQGCNDTTIYIIAVYFGSIKMKKIGYVLKAGLLNDLITFLGVFFLCYLFFKII